MPLPGEPGREAWLRAQVAKGRAARTCRSCLSAEIGKHEMGCPEVRRWTAECREVWREYRGLALAWGLVAAAWALMYVAVAG